MVGFRQLSLHVAVGIVVPYLTFTVTALPVIDRRAPRVVPNKYIVTLKPGVSPPDVGTHLKWVRGVHSRSLAKRDTAGVEKVYSIDDFNAYAGSFDAHTIEEIRNSDQVAAVEADMVWHLNGDGGSLVTQGSAPWGLGSISHRAGSSTDYIYNSVGGQGTFAYVVDTGIATSHVEFEGRAQLGYVAYPKADHVDRLGHGTHVAGTVGSRAYGVAKKAALIAVKVFDTGPSTTSIVLDGFNWAVNNITASGRAAKSVINMSLSGPASPVFDLAVSKAYEVGVLTVAAAGNEGLDASSSSPASASETVTVGVVDEFNTKPWWGNYGASVDIFAPGVGVISCWIGSDAAAASLDGTSMAAPHVAGLALYLKSIDPQAYAAPADIAARLTALGTPGLVQSGGTGSPNLLAYNGNGA